MKVTGRLVILDQGTQRTVAALELIAPLDGQELADLRTAIRNCTEHYGTGLQIRDPESGEWETRVTDAKSAWEARKRRIREAMPSEPRVVLKKIESVIAGGLQDFIGQNCTPETRAAIEMAVKQAIENCPHVIGADLSKYEFEVRQADDDPSALVLIPLNEETAELFRQLHAEGEL